MTLNFLNCSPVPSLFSKVEEQAVVSKIRTVVKIKFFIVTFDVVETIIAEITIYLQYKNPICL